MQFMTREQAKKALQMAEEVQEGRRPLPSEILETKRKIREATRRAFLFIQRLNAVDEGMIHEVVRLKLELDRLYAEWVIEEAGG